MKFLSICSGIEAASAAWKPLGWEAVGFSEIEPFPSAVLKHHYPEVPNHGDMTKFMEWPDATIDVLCGGTPCQSFSVAGLRKGLDDPRGNLMLTFLAIAKRYRPTWVVWENVPGVLSSNGGRDFGSFLGGLAECGYGFAYRVLDAQYFGLAQRRKRVFVVGHLGDWHRAAAVLFEQYSLQGNPAPSREAGKVAAHGAAESFGIRSANTSSNGWGIQRELTHTLDTASPQIVGTIGCNTGPNGHGFGDFLNNQAVDAGHIVPTTTHTLRGEGFDASEVGTGRGTSLVPVAYSIMPMNSGKDYKAREVEVAQPLMAGGPVGGNQGGDFVAQPVTYDFFNITAPVNRQSRTPGDPCHTLARSNAEHAVVMGPVGFTRCDHGGDAVIDGTPTMRCGSNYSAHLAVAFHPTQDPISSTEVCHAIGTGSGQGCATAAVAFAQNQLGEVRAGDVFNTINTNSNASGRNTPMLATAMQVRRLTPRECERLQGFPDGYTAIPWRNKPASECPDGPRYKALGNSWAVPVVRWIGERIMAVNEIKPTKAKGY